MPTPGGLEPSTLVNTRIISRCKRRHVKTGLAAAIFFMLPIVDSARQDAVNFAIYTST
jgi:hypothetical protein